MPEFNRSLSVGSETSLSPLPIKLTFLCTTGTRATLILDKSFLTEYSLPFKDTESLTVGALKQVIYDEWISHLESHNSNTAAKNPSTASSFLIPNNDSSITETKNENSQSQGVFTKDKPGDSNTHANQTDLTFSNTQLNPTGSNNHLSGSNTDSEWASILANSAGQPPSSPSHIRLIYFGQVLKDENTLEEYKLTASNGIYATSSPQPAHAGSEDVAINKSSSTENLKDHNNAHDNGDIQSQNQQQLQQQQLLNAPVFVVHLSVRPASLDASTLKNIKANKRRNKRRGNSRDENQSQNSRRSSDSEDDERSGRCCIIS